jgi:hypothetical protein
MGRLPSAESALEARTEERRTPVRPRRPVRMVAPRRKGPSAVLVSSLLVLMAILVYLLLS